MRTGGVGVPVALRIMRGVGMVMGTGRPGRLDSGIDGHADARDSGGGAPDEDKQRHQDEG